MIHTYLPNTAQEQPEWARGWLFDCADKWDVKLAQPSDINTVFDGEGLMDRNALRRMAEEIGCSDLDILRQLDGGIELRSSCAPHTVLAWHHSGVAKHFSTVRSEIEQDLSRKWVKAPVAHLPFVPARALPKNVVLQEKQRMQPDGTVVAVMKPRLTTNHSYGDEESVNAGVARLEKAISLPTIGHHSAAIAIVHRAGREDKINAGCYIIDARDAFRYMLVQVLCHHRQMFVWFDPDTGAAGFCVDPRGNFGGAELCNRFTRVIDIPLAVAAARQAAFDAEQPPPDGVQHWEHLRRGLQHSRLLPPCSGQCRPAHIQVRFPLTPKLTAHVTCIQEQLHSRCIPCVYSTPGALAACTVRI